jgi:hypothetical protein
LKRYGYSDRLWLHNVQRNITIRLTDSSVARSYFSAVNPDKNSGCPTGIEGIGSPFP